MKVLIILPVTLLIAYKQSVYADEQHQWPTAEEVCGITTNIKPPSFRFQTLYTFNITISGNVSC
jgi:hypothetical protein